MNPIQAEGRILASERLQAQSELWNHIFNYIDSMSLKCAVELGIPDAIYRHGRPISLFHLASAIDIPPTKSSHLHRLMRLLTHSGVFSQQIFSNSDANLYSLTPISQTLINDKDIGGLSPCVLAMLDPVFISPFHSMGAWFKGESPSSFALTHGHGFWDETSKNPMFNETFNAGMSNDASFLLDVLVGECGEIFKGVSSLVDVGGGTGAAARTIARTFPKVKCSVLELPYVIDAASKDGGVEFIKGDMFEQVPQADAVLLKSILHDWGDDDCVKILRRCKDAIPCREKGGKLIIIDMVLGSEDSHHNSRGMQLYFDILMLVSFNSVERGEHEWKKIFVEAGFTSYKITPALGLRSVIEVYP